MPSALMHSNYHPISIADTLARTSTPGSASFVARQVEQIRRSDSTSFYHQRRITADEYFTNLNHLSNTGNDWNTYGSPVPTKSSIDAAHRITSWFVAQGLVPDKVRPSAEGGVALAFIGLERNRAMTEILNNGEQFIMLYDVDGASETIEWKESLPPADAVNRLFHHLRG